MDHNWPTKPELHMWSIWMNKTPRKGTQPPTQYRICVHPTCTESETRETPSG